MERYTFATCTGILVSLLVLFVISIFLNGWALSVIWNWFVPQIFNLVPLSIWQAIGVSMVFSLFTGTNNLARKQINIDTSKLSYGEVFTDELVKVILIPVLNVVFAYIVLQLAF